MFGFVSRDYLGRENDTDASETVEILKKKKGDKSELDKKFEAELEEIKQLTGELSLTKSYLHSLPTNEQIMILKKDLVCLQEEKIEIEVKLTEEKRKNTKLNEENLSFKKEICELSAMVKTKQLEVEATQLTLQQWEARRRHALGLGQITVEDILTEKLELEKQLHEASIITSKFEKYLQNANSVLEAQEKKCQDILKESQQKEADSEESLKILEGNLQNSIQEYIKLGYRNRDLQTRCESLACQLLELQADNECYEDNHEVAADQSETSGVSCSSRATSMSSHFKDLLEDKKNQLALIRESMLECQEEMMRLYTDKLSSGVSSECTVQ